MASKKFTGNVLTAFVRKGKLHSVGSKYTTDKLSFDYLIKTKRLEK